MRIVFNGGKYPLNKSGRPQKAVLEFVCDKDKTGLEGETTPEDLYDKPESRRLRAREDGKEGDGKEGDGDGDGDGDGNQDDGTEKQIVKSDSALLWNSYGSADDNDKTDVLRLTWHTKHACEGAYKNPDNDKGGSGDGDSDKPTDESSSWGFFTWFILMYVSYYFLRTRKG